MVFNPEYVYILESKRRDRWQKPCEVIQALGIKREDVIADIGAGGGYFMEHFSQAVGETGLVYATDVQPAMVKKLRERACALELNNVRVVHAAFDDPSLPSKCCDLVFFSSVYKEISGRIAYMKKVRQILRPQGRVAILEFRLITLGLGPPLHLRLRRSRVIKELNEAGFELVNEFKFLPREYFLIFSFQGE